MTSRKCKTIFKADVDSFDPSVLHDAFEDMIQDLKKLKTQVELQEERLRIKCKEEEQAHWQNVTELQKKNQVLIVTDILCMIWKYMLFIMYTDILT